MSVGRMRNYNSRICSNSVLHDGEDDDQIVCVTKLRSFVKRVPVVNEEPSTITSQAQITVCHLINHTRQTAHWLPFFFGSALVGSERPNLAVVVDAEYCRPIPSLPSHKGFQLLELCSG